MTDEETAFPPGTLRVAAVLVAVETVAQIVIVLRRDDIGAALRGIVVMTLALKFLLLWAVFRRSPGAMLLLLLFEFTAIFVALVPSGLHVLGRLALGLGALSALVLLGASARAFPSPTLPHPIPPPEPDDDWPAT